MAFFELQDAQEITRLIGEIDQALQLVSPASRMAVLVSGLNAEGASAPSVGISTFANFQGA